MACFDLIHTVSAPVVRVAVTADALPAGALLAVLVMPYCHS